MSLWTLHKNRLLYWCRKSRFLHIHVKRKDVTDKIMTSSCQNVFWPNGQKITPNVAIILVNTSCGAQRARIQTSDSGVSAFNVLTFVQRGLYQHVSSAHLGSASMHGELYLRNRMESMAFLLHGWIVSNSWI